MREAAVSVTLREWEGAVHGFTLLPTKEGKAAMAEIRDFVLDRLPV